MFIYRPRVRADRLNEAQVASARDQRLREIHMWSILHEIFTYICFFSLLSIVVYSNRSPDAFLQVNHLRKYFLNSRQTDSDYTKVRFLL